MKTIKYLILIALFSACEIDNYASPASELKGKVLYNDLPVGVRSGGVQLELWQPGYALNNKIPVYINQDGSFTASLFDGKYKLTFVSGNGPWVVSRDTILLEVKGKTEVSLPVKPYYVPRNENITVNGGKVNATFSIETVDNSRQVQAVGLYIGTTEILDNINNKQRVELQGAAIGSLTQPIQISADLISSLAQRNYVFGRLGIRITGVNEMIFSPVVKLNLK
jgi:hypothetical protein